MLPRPGKYWCTSRQRGYAGEKSTRVDVCFYGFTNMRRLKRSDIHFWKTGRIGPLVVEGDCILGHEAAGVVVKCAEGVTTLKPGRLSLGDRALIQRC